MTVDIDTGHVLVVDSVEYAIRKCNPWLDLVTDSVLSMMTKTASTKKPPAIVSGKRGEPATNLTGLHCSPVWPASNETREREMLKTPINLYECYVDGTDTIYHLVLEDNTVNG